MCAIWLLFLLLRELVGNAFYRTLIAMAELSFGEPTRSSRHACGEHLSVYFRALSSLTEGANVSSTLTREKSQTTVDGNKSTAPACFILKQLHEFAKFMGTIFGHLPLSVLV